MVDTSGQGSCLAESADGLKDCSLICEGGKIAAVGVTHRESMEEDFQSIKSFLEHRPLTQERKGGPSKVCAARMGQC